MSTLIMMMMMMMMIYVGNFVHTVRQKWADQ